jgi:hypothetical protein
MDLSNYQSNPLSHPQEKIEAWCEWQWEEGQNII